MDYIKRKICLEGARTRTQGLMPYYEFGTGNRELVLADGPNGNWGQFVANPCFLADEGKTYETMLHNYYSLLNMVRDGVKLRKVETKDEETIFTEDVGSFVWDDECFSGGTAPDYLYDYAAYNSESFTSTQIDSLREETRNIYRTEKPEEVTHDFIVLIGDYEKFSGMANYFSGVTIPTGITNNGIRDDEHEKWADYCEIVDDIIGNIKVPASIFNKHIKVPKSMPCADVKEYKDWLENYQKLSADCCNARLWEDMGGEDMLAFLNDHEDDCENKRAALEAIGYAVPYIEMSLLLRQNYTDVGVLTNIDGVDYDENVPGPVNSGATRPHGKMSANTDEEESGLTDYDIALFEHSGFGLTIDEIVMSCVTKDYPVSGDTAIEVESLLWTLRDRKKYVDDHNNLLPGIFQPISDNPFFICESGASGWNISEYPGPIVLGNGDGLSSEEIAGEPLYRSVTTASAGKRICEVYSEENGDEATATTFYFKVKYDNSSGTPMEIPYHSGNVANAYYVTSGITGETTNYLYRGDYIKTISSSDTTFEVEYVVGGYYSGDTRGTLKTPALELGGDIYYEKYTLQPNHVDYVALDGVDNVPIYSNYIDFDGAAKEFYSPRYNLYRTGNTANIISMTSGEFWVKKNSDGYSYANDAYLAKEDYLTNFSLPPKVDVNVTIDRGGVSAFEKHYKLSECNTMQDLVNYGNNFFNI